MCQRPVVIVLVKILGRALCYQGDMSPVDTVASAMVRLVEAAPCVMVGMVDGCGVDTAIRRITTGTDKAAVVVIPLGNVASLGDAPSGDGCVLDLGEVLDGLPQGLDLAVAGITLVLHFGQQIGDGSLRFVDLRIGLALLLE